MPRTPRERSKGIQYSAILHGAMLLIAIFGLPWFFSESDPIPEAITVEILPISEVSNVRPSQVTPTKKEDKPEEKQVEKKEPPKPPAEKKKEVPVPKVKTEEPEPEPEPVPEEKVEKKEPEKKKEEPKKKEKKKDKQDDLAAVLKAVQQESAEEQNDTPKEDKKNTSQSQSKSSQYDDSKPMSISEMDMIRSQIAKCWSVPAGAKDAYTLIIHVKVQYNPDATVIKAELAMGDYARYASDSYFRAAADAAIRAVHKCSPLKNLPADKYGTWGDMEITFDPKDMLY